MKIDYTLQTYNINNVTGFSFQQALKLWKCRHKTFDNFKSDLSSNYDTTDFNDFFETVEKEWDSIKDITASEAFALDNIEQRRTYFDILGVEKLMEELKPTLVDSETIVRENTVYDNDGNSKVETLTDTYELYKIDKSLLFKDLNMKDWSAKRHDNDCYAVKCKDASTDRTYWIYVPESIGEKGSAIEAIAWTYTVPNNTNISAIHRQGEVIISEHSKNTEDVMFKSWTTVSHIEREHYMNLVKSQS